MPKLSRRVVIVGAGVAGLATACGLQKNGYTVTVIERGGEPQMPVGDWQARVSAFSPASINFLTSLGAWPEASDRVRPYRYMNIWADGDFDNIQFSADELGYPALGAIAENGLLQYQLWTLARSLGVELYADSEWVELTCSVDGVVLALSDDMALEAEWLIAADGAQSKIRETLKIARQGWRYEQQAIVCNVYWDKDESGVPAIGDTAAQRFMKSGPLAFLPLSEAQSSLVWSLEKDSFAAMQAMNDSGFKDALNTAIGKQLGTSVKSVSGRFGFPLQLAQASRYIEGRCILIGDAAHNVHPLAGQGLNLGILDARDLVTAFAELSDFSLRAWQRKRRAKTAEMMALTDVLYRSYRVGLGYERGSRVGFLRYAASNASRSLLSAGMAAAGGSALLRQQLARLAVESDA